MNLRMLACVLSVAASAACGQQPQVFGTLVSYNFQWSDIPGNANGILEPGESARVTLSISLFLGEPYITWNPVIGGSGQGTCRGLQAIFFDLIGDSGAEGEWTGLGVHPQWDLLGPAGYGTTAAGGARLNSIQAGQFPPTQAAVNTSNPIADIWSGTWTPASYSPRNANFAIASGTGNPHPFPSFVIVRDPLIHTVVLAGTSEHAGGGFQIPIVPAPGAAIVLGSAGCIGLARPRRRVAWSREPGTLRDPLSRMGNCHMNRMIAGGVSTVLMSVGVACGQQVYGSNVHYELTWQDTGNSNGVLEPGESIQFSLSVQMTPSANSPITWNTVIGGSGSGLIRGIQTVFFDLVGSPNAVGSWSNLHVLELWDLVGPLGYGTPAAGGSRLNNIQAGQFPPTQASVNTTNAVQAIWTGTWTPASYTPQVYTFTTVTGSANPTGFASNVIVRDDDLGLVVYTGTSATTHNTVVLIPSPGLAAMLGASAILGLRRRRL